MELGGKHLKRCSTSTYAEADHARTKPLEKAKRKLENLETKANPKKPAKKVRREKSKNKQSDSEPKSIRKKKSEKKPTDEHKLKLKTHETESEKKEKETEEVYECCYETTDFDYNSWNTISVRGFDPSPSRKATKRALKQHFRSCGKVERVFVPVECKTGATVGYAHIDMRFESIKAALKLHGSLLGGWRLEVRMAKDTKEYQNHPFRCERCATILTKLSIQTRPCTGNYMYPPVNTCIIAYRF